MRQKQRVFLLLGVLMLAMAAAGRPDLITARQTAKINMRTTLPPDPFPDFSSSSSTSSPYSPPNASSTGGGKGEGMNHCSSPLISYTTAICLQVFVLPIANLGLSHWIMELYVPAGCKLALAIAAIQFVWVQKKTGGAATNDQFWGGEPREMLQCCMVFASAMWWIVDSVLFIAGEIRDVNGCLPARGG